MDIGDKYGNWTIISFAPDRIDGSGKHHKRVTVKCDCGTVIDKDVYKLINGASMCKSCYLKIANRNSIPFKRLENIYEFRDGYMVGYATNTNNEFYFNVEDYEKVKMVCWHEEANGYIFGYDCESKKKIALHRYVMDCEQDDFVLDHINRNPKDCRRENLRLCTQSENTYNRSIYKNNKSGYRGVFFDKRSNKWIAYINKDYKRYTLGYYEDKDIAIAKRIAAEKELFGRYSPN